MLAPSYRSSLAPHVFLVVIAVVGLLALSQASRLSLPYSVSFLGKCGVCEAITGLGIRLDSF